MSLLRSASLLLAMGCCLAAQGSPLPGTEMQVERVELGEGLAPSDPCESLPAAVRPMAARAGKVIGVLTGDTLLIQLKGIGLKKIRLAGVEAPAEKSPLAAVSRYHLSRRAQGQLVWVVLDAPHGPWPERLTAAVEQLAECQLEMGLVAFREAEAERVGAYAACRARRLQAFAKASGLGLWRLN